PERGTSNPMEIPLRLGLDPGLAEPPQGGDEQDRSDPADSREFGSAGRRLSSGVAPPESSSSTLKTEMASRATRKPRRQTAPTASIYEPARALFTIRWASSTMLSRWAWSLKLSA